MKIFIKARHFFIIILLIPFFTLVPIRSSGQTISKQVSIDSISKDSVVLAWLEDLYKEEVTVVDDSVLIGKEATRLFTDANYRSMMYPKAYAWETVIYFIQRQDIKRACWFMLNLYLTNEQNKDLVVKSLLTYDQLLKMDKILTNSFYSYILSDTEIGSFVDGQYKVTAPHIMEKKLNALKEILFYLDKYRKDNEPPGK